ncbi:MAG: hypothetical protein WEB13_03175 [Dehalococcoidia bacterium]
MVQANPEPSVDERSQTLIATYDDFELLGTGDVDAFVLDLNERPGTPPFFVHVDGRRFVLQRDTFLVRGHGATMPQWIREQESDGRLVLLAERDGRYIVYVFDPDATDDEGDE